MVAAGRGVPAVGGGWWRVAVAKVTAEYILLLKFVTYMYMTRTHTILLYAVRNAKSQYAYSVRTPRPTRGVQASLAPRPTLSATGTTLTRVPEPMSTFFHDVAPPPSQLHLSVAECEAAGINLQAANRTVIVYFRGSW